MNDTHSNGNKFKAPKGERLSPREAILIRQYLIAASLSLGLMFDRLSRMNEDDQYHPNPAAKFGAPVTYNAVETDAYTPAASTQPVTHEALAGMTAEQQTAEVAALNEMFAESTSPDESQMFQTLANTVAQQESNTELDQKVDDFMQLRANVDEAYRNNGAYENV